VKDQKCLSVHRGCSGGVDAVVVGVPAVKSVGGVVETGVVEVGEASFIVVLWDVDVADGDPPVGPAG